MNEYADLLLSGLLLGVSVAAPVGPSSVAIINRGLSGGFVPSLLVGLGTATADGAYLFLVRFGIAPLLTRALGLTLGNPMTIVSWLTLGGAAFARLAHLGDAAMTGFVLSTLSGIVLWFLALSALVSYFRRFLKPSVFRLITAAASLVLLGFAARFGFQAITAAISVLSE